MRSPRSPKWAASPNSEGRGARARRGVKLAPHSPYFGPGAIATLHLLAALAEDARFEYFYLWADAALFGSILEPKHGELTVPGAPGLGADPDPDLLRRYRAD